MKKAKNKLGRPLDGKERKERYSVRLEPTIYKRLVDKYGSFSEAVKDLLKGKTIKDD